LITGMFVGLGVLICIWILEKVVAGYRKANAES